ncbi:MAG: hypothetical protein ACI8SR_000417 [Oceanicoccus sp.]|jgi:hypothetical protein
MNKFKLFTSILVITSLGLVGCSSSSSSDKKEDPRSTLTDLDLAKDYTKRFVKVEQAIIDMQQPMINTTEQFIKDAQEVNSDEVEASLVALSSTLYLALSVVDDAIMRDSSNDVTGVDYSKLNSSYALSELLSDVCKDKAPCMPSADLSTGGSVTYSNNTLSVSNVQVSTELFSYHTEWKLVNSGYYEEENIRDESKGTFTNTISFDINLPKPDLNGANELAFGISNLNLQTASSIFAVTMDNFDINGKLSSVDILTLNQLLTSDEQKLSAIGANLTNIVMTFGSATFKGSMQLNASSVDGIDFNNANAMVSGALINSNGDSIKANLDLGISEYKEKEEDSYSQSNNGFTWKSAESGSESFNFDFNLELIYTSQEHGELSVKLSALGEYADDYASSYSSNSANDYSYSSSENEYKYNDHFLASGNIEVNVAGEILKLTYGAEGKDEESSKGSYSHNPDGSSSSENERNESRINSIKITDASYTERNLYIKLNIDSISTTSYSHSNGENKNANKDTFEVKSGVFVGDVQYGDFTFDALENTLIIEFTDGEKVNLSH